MTDREWADKASHENYDRVLRVAYKRACEHHIPDPENWAMDVTQTVFLLFYAQIKEKNLRAHPNITGWLFAVLYHVIGNEARKAKRREVPTDGIEALRQAPVGRLVIDELFPAGLSEEDCDLLYRCHCLQIPRREIAASLGISLGACQMRLERAEERFRRLRDGGVAASRQGPPEKI